MSRSIRLISELIRDLRFPQQPLFSRDPTRVAGGNRGFAPAALVAGVRLTICHSGDLRHGQADDGEVTVTKGEVVVSTSTHR